MARDDWYRNKDWNADTEAAFRAKLSRSRSGRPRYIVIQAYCLIDRHPMVTLSLIDEYFKTDDDFNVPTALSARAEAYEALGKIDEAIKAYKEALNWESEHPNHITNSRIDYPKLVVNCRLTDEYAYAQDILITRFNPSDHSFPLTRYYWNGCNALIANETGHAIEAQEFAERALRAAAETESPFRFHRSVGVVRQTNDDFGRRIKRIARPSTVRTLLKLFVRG